MAVFPAFACPRSRSDDYEASVLAVIWIIGIRLKQPKNNASLDGFDWVSDRCVKIKPVMYLKRIPIPESLKYRDIFWRVERPPQCVSIHNRDSQHEG